MNHITIEEAIVDWHRLGHTGPIPCEYIQNLHSFFKTYPHERYVTYHIKTINYFEHHALRTSLWLFIGAQLEKLMLTHTNQVIHNIERTHRKKLSPQQCIYYGHVMLVTLGAPWTSRRERAHFLHTTMEYPEKLLQNITRLVDLAYTR